MALKEVTAEGVSRILRATGIPHGPHFIDERLLKEALDQCAEWFSEAEMFSTEALEKKQRKQLELVLSSLNLLTRRLKDDAVWDSKFWHHRTRTNGINAPRETVSALAAMIEQELLKRRIDPSGLENLYRYTFQVWSPFEWLFGDWLPAVFQSFGFSNAASAEDLASKVGPYLRFAQAVAKELGIKKGRHPYAPASFIKVVRTVASDRPRRRPTLDDEDRFVYSEDRRDKLRRLGKQSAEGQK